MSGTAMKKIANGDGWFDIQMTAEERDILLHGLNFALKNHDALDYLEVDTPDDIKAAIRVLTERTKPVDKDFVSRMDMDGYMTVSMTISSMLSTIRANQIDMPRRDPTLDVEKLHNAQKAWDDALPSKDVTPELYPKERQRHIRESMEIWRGQKTS